MGMRALAPRPRLAGARRARPPATSIRGGGGGSCRAAAARQTRHVSSSSSSSSSGSSPSGSRPKTALFFPGQGVQKVGMLTPWLEAFPSTVAPLVDEIDDTLGFRLSRVIRDGPGPALTATPNAQPAIMATSVVILRVLERDFGFSVGRRVDFTLGHSLGEFAALVAAGNLGFGDSLRMVRARAEAMADATRRARARFGGDYGMVAVVTEPERLEALVRAIRDFVGPGASKAESGEDVPPIDQVLIANVNSRNQIVLSGSIDRIRTLVAHVRQFLGHDPRAVRLNSDSPFHSPIMEPAVAVMRTLLGGRRGAGGPGGGGAGAGADGDAGGDMVTFPGRVPCVSNVTARPFGSRAELKDLLARQCVETVRWWDSIRYLDREARVRRWVGIGPGKVGRNLVGKEVGMRGTDEVRGGGVWAITDPGDIEGVLAGLDMTDRWGGEEAGDDEAGDDEAGDDEAGGA